MKSVSDVIVFFVRITRFADLLEVQGVNIGLLVHQMVAVLAFDLHAAEALAFVLNDLRHFVATEVLIIRGALHAA